MDNDTIQDVDTGAPCGGESATTKQAERGACRPVRRGAKVPEVGTRMTARVYRILHEGAATVVLPGKIHALLSGKHFSWVEWKVDLSKRLKVGQTIEVVVRKIETRANGNTWVKVSHRLTRPNPWEQIDQEHPAGHRTMGQVKAVASAGVWVELETGYEAFVPMEEISYSRKDRRPQEKLEIGAWIELVIQSTDAQKQLIVASHRQAMGNPWETIDQTHPVGSKAWGEVEGIASAGIFVTLESGLNALVPWAETSWKLYKSQPRAEFKIGDRIEVEIQSMDKERQRIRASHRLTLANPWDAFVARHPIGSEQTGIVHEVVAFGLFVRLEDGLVGLLHTSRLRADTAWSVGDTVRVRIVDCTPAAERIGLADVAHIDSEAQQNKQAA